MIFEKTWGLRWIASFLPHANPVSLPKTLQTWEHRILVMSEWLHAPLHLPHLSWDCKRYIKVQRTDLLTLHVCSPSSEGLAEASICFLRLHATPWLNLIFTPKMKRLVRVLRAPCSCEKYVHTFACRLSIKHRTYATAKADIHHDYSLWAIHRLEGAQTVQVTSDISYFREFNKSCIRFSIHEYCAAC